MDRAQAATAPVNSACYLKISALSGIRWVKVPRVETMAARELSQKRDDYGLVPTT